MKQLFLFLTTMLLSLTASAETVEIDGIYYNLNPYEMTAGVSSNPNGYSGDIVIPAVVNYEGNNYDVTSIMSYAFDKCSELTAITIPNSVTSIGYSAFYECRSLISLTIPNSVTSIGGCAFYYCSSITTVNISNSVKTIGDCAFQGCTNLKSITIPDNVITIGNYAFCGCSSLTSIAIPSSVTTIGDAAFESCIKLTSVSIPSSITTFGDYAFYGCYCLTSVTIANGVTNIGNYTFIYCSALTSINIPNSVTSIGEGAFQYCSLLKELQLPDKLKIIKRATFQSCNSLKSVTIPATVEFIYAEAFYGCNALESIKALPENPPFIYDNTFSNYSAPLIVPQGCKEAYQSAQGWKNFTDISDSRHKLTYMVDGEEYKSYIIESGTAITPEPEPTKDTYKFSGWSEIPETMPNHDVIVTGTFERYFDVGHLAKVINFVMKSNASASDVALFDLNNDEELNIGDVILIVKNILNHGTNSMAAIGRRAGEMIDLTQYTAAQFEVKMADSKDIRLVSSMAQTHQLMYQQKDENTYSVVVFSLSNQLMNPENGSIIEMNGVESSIQNVVMAKPNGETDCYHGLPVSTGIQQIENGTSSAVIYDLKGNRLNSVKALDKGIYIVNGKKAVVR